MNAYAVRIGVGVLALVLVAVGFLLKAPWLAMVAVVLALVAVAFTT